MDTDERARNKEVVRRFVEEFQTQAREDVLDELVSRDFVNHSGTVKDIPGMGGATDFEGLLEIDRMYRRSFPNQRVTILDQAGSIVSTLSSNTTADEIGNNRTEPAKWRSGIANAPHGIKNLGDEVLTFYFVKWIGVGR